MAESDDLDNAQINPSALLSYLGIRGIGYNPTEEETFRLFNGVPLLAYWEIYKNYYSNKQEGVGYFIKGYNESKASLITGIEATEGSLNWAINEKPNLSDDNILTETTLS